MNSANCSRQCKLIGPQCTFITCVNSYAYQLRYKIVPVRLCAQQTHSIKSSGRNSHVHLLVALELLPVADVARVPCADDKITVRSVNHATIDELRVSHRARLSDQLDDLIVNQKENKHFVHAKIMRPA